MDKVGVVMSKRLFVELFSPPEAAMDPVADAAAVECAPRPGSHVVAWYDLTSEHPADDDLDVARLSGCLCDECLTSRPWNGST